MGQPESVALPSMKFGRVDSLLAALPNIMPSFGTGPELPRDLIIVHNFI